VTGSSPRSITRPFRSHWSRTAESTRRSGCSRPGHRS
jgi:hypothetical protein